MRCSLVIKIDLDVVGANGKWLKKFNGAKAPSGPGPPHYRGFTIALRQITRYDSSGRVISPAQRSPPDNTQYSQETDIHALGRIRTHNPSK